MRCSPRLTLVSQLPIMPVVSSRVGVRLVIGLAMAIGAGRAQGQSVRTVGDLLASVPAVASLPVGASATELTIRWLVAASATGTVVSPGDLVPLNQLQIVGRGAVRGALVRERDPQWSPDDLAVVILDAAGRETSWQKVRDPRLVRAELPGPTGELQGRVFYRAVAELVVTVPDIAAAASLRVYEGYVTGGQLVLREVAQLTVTQP